MKPHPRLLLLLVPLSACLLVLSHAADNYSVGDTRTTGTTDKVIKRSTEVSPGIHADHVILEGDAAVITPTLTVDTAVYASGDSIGGKITLTGALRTAGRSALLQSITITDRANQKPTGYLLIFNADPTAATITDNAAFASSTDDFKILCVIPVVTGDYATIGSSSKAYASLSSLGRVVSAASGTTLYAAFVATGAPDFVAASDLQIQFGILRD